MEPTSLGHPVFEDLGCPGAPLCRSTCEGREGIRHSGEGLLHKFGGRFPSAKIVGPVLFRQLEQIFLQIGQEDPDCLRISCLCAFEQAGEFIFGPVALGLGKSSVHDVSVWAVVRGEIRGRDGGRLLAARGELPTGRGGGGI